MAMHFYILARWQVVLMAYWIWYNLIFRVQWIVLLKCRCAVHCLHPAPCPAQAPGIISTVWSAGPAGRDSVTLHAAAWHYRDIVVTSSHAAMEGLLAARIVSMICLGLVTWVVGEDRRENIISKYNHSHFHVSWSVHFTRRNRAKNVMQCLCFLWTHATKYATIIVLRGKISAGKVEWRVTKWPRLSWVCTQHPGVLQLVSGQLCLIEIVTIHILLRACGQICN